MRIQAGAWAGANSQETSPDAISPDFGALLSGPAICSTSAAVMSLQGFGMAGWAVAIVIDPPARIAATPHRNTFDASDLSRPVSCTNRLVCIYPYFTERF